MSTLDANLICIYSLLGPPTPTILTPEDLQCDDPLNDGRTVKITWSVSTLCHLHGLCIVTSVVQYGAGEEDAAGDVNISVEVNPNAAGCSNVTADSTSCTATITSDGNYTVTLTVTNKQGSASAQSTFDCELCIYYMYIHVTGRSGIRLQQCEGSIMHRRWNPVRIMGAPVSVCVCIKWAGQVRMLDLIRQLRLPCAQYQIQCSTTQPSLSGSYTADYHVYVYCRHYSTANRWRYMGSMLYPSVVAQNPRASPCIAAYVT